MSWSRVAAPCYRPELSAQAGAEPFMRLALITPVYPPASGGGAYYSRQLALGLAERNRIEHIAIYTEAFPGQPRGSRFVSDHVTISRVFPFRAGRDDKPWHRYLLYVWQNLQFVALPLWLPSSTTVLLVHGSFHHHPNFMVLAMHLLRRLRKGHLGLMADMRDPCLPNARFHELYPYDRIICCSESVVRHLEVDPQLKKKLVLIPIILDVTRPNTDTIASALDRFGLADRPYLLSSNGISLKKRIDEAIDVTRRLRARGHNLALVVVGRRRDWQPRHQQAIDDGEMIYLGSVRNSDVLALAAGSELVINLSRIEAPSRASLEAIAVGARTLLPPNVPEFERACPGYVASSSDPEVLADQVETILRQPLSTNIYDLSLHSPERVLPLYEQLFEC